MVRAETVSRNGWPVATAAIAAGSLLLFVLPGAGEGLVYDRERILGGEVWRLLTGHVVHLSASHLVWNLLLFAVAGAWVELRERRQFTRLVGGTALAASLYFLAFLPDMARFGGLSGATSALVVGIALDGLRGGGMRIVWAVLLALFAAKVGCELATAQPIFAAPGAEPFAVVPAAHIFGALVAAGAAAAAPRRAQKSS